MSNGAAAAAAIMQAIKASGAIVRVEPQEFEQIFRTYPKTSVYCDRLQRPGPALSAKNVLTRQGARLRAFFTSSLGRDLFARSRHETGLGRASIVRFLDSSE